jgi:glycosyltransferase involved in cell wall biosynthesis
VDAAHLLVQRLPDVRVLVLGEGELRVPLEQQVRKLRLERHVLLPGFRPDVLSLLKGADVFAMSSVTEGLGTSVLDAMACRKAVVATRVGGIPEVVVDGTTGRLVPARDSEAMAEALGDLLDRPERRAAFGEAGRQRVERDFSADRMVVATLAAYQRVADRIRTTDMRRSAAGG